jgi:uncharacterized peroxidase-related enzyme
VAHLEPLPIETTPELAETFRFFLGTLGFVPNSVRIMQRRPKLVRALQQMNAAAMDPEGSVDLGFRRLVGHVASRVAGCAYCMAHTALGAANFGVSEEKLAAVWDYQTSPHYSEAERAALDFAAAAAAVPNAVDAPLMARMRAHWSEDQIVEILGVVCLFGFLNRWNDSMATPLEERAGAVGHSVLEGRGWSPGKHGG